MKLFYFSVIWILWAIGSIVAEPIEDVIIIGSGPAGYTSAIYASRAGLSTLLVEGNQPGGQITLSYLIENYPGFPKGIEGYELGMNMHEQAIRFGTRIQSGHVVKTDLQESPFTLLMEDGTRLLAKTLIIATGSSAKWLGLDSEKALIGKGVGSCAVCDGFVYKNKEVVVVGGGDFALEDALFLTNYASKVTVIHRRDSLRASKFLQDKAFAHPKIHFIWDNVVEDILSKSEFVSGVMIKNLKTNQMTKCDCEGVFIAIGHKPNSDLFVDQLTLNKEGYIKTRQPSTQTNIPGVFAAGDVADPLFRQAITSAGTGCIAGIEAYQFIQQQKPKESL